ncbi:cytochrome oxidase [Thalassoglobus sp. JC818]|uniref:c-type cytochrome n=1 Tax=Thalassoglobus sp. JC818 TaxID=3232136 RepID=UPI00345A7795
MNRVGTIAQLLIVGLCILWSAVNLSAAESVEPFVAGFDRFAKSSRLPESTAGKLLLTELSCTACHLSFENDTAPKRGPDLKAVGSRVQAEWMKRFLSAPHDVKPGTTMPDVLHGLQPDEKANVVDPIVAFLQTQTEAFAKLKATGRNPVPHEFWSKGRSDVGQKLFHTIGCVACHEPDPEYSEGQNVSAQDQSLLKLIEGLTPEEIEELGLSHLAETVNSVPFGKLDEKYSHQSLAYFLMDTLKVRPSGRMPSFDLTPIEASHVVAFLMGDQPRETRAMTLPTVGTIELDDEALQVQIKQGREYFTQFGCANCHDVAESFEPRLGPALTALDFSAEESCLKSPTSKEVFFPLSDQQVAAVRNELQTLIGDQKEQVNSFPEAAWTMLQLNCFACHQRNGLGGVGPGRRGFFETVGNVDIGDEGKLPPPLTHTGAKLKSKWIESVLKGESSIRPYLTIQMPRFPSQTCAALPKAFHSEDKIALAENSGQPATDQSGFTEKQLQSAGRELFNTGCVQCHPLQSESLPSVVGVDLGSVTDRVHQDWFDQFLLNPIALKERTRMPSFFPNGVSSNQEILNGDVENQIAALWAYLGNVDQAGFPEKIVVARQQDFELFPKDRPVILRTFMESAGTHAIAVGFPENVHVAFDAEKVGLSEIWRGRFLDAHGTWFDRFTPPAVPLGQDRLGLSDVIEAVFVRKGSGRNGDRFEFEFEQRFLGYRLDENGVPTFRSELGDIIVEQRFEPTERNGLKQLIHLKSRNGAPIFEEFGMVLGPQMIPTLDDPRLFSDRKGMTVFVRSEAVMRVVTMNGPDRETVEDDSLNDQAEDEKSAGRSVLTSPIGNQLSLEVEYHW